MTPQKPNRSSRKLRQYPWLLCPSLPAPGPWGLSCGAAPLNSSTSVHCSWFPCCAHGKDPWPLAWPSTIASRWRLCFHFRFLPVHSLRWNWRHWSVKRIKLITALPHLKSFIGWSPTALRTKCPKPWTISPASSTQLISLHFWCHRSCSSWWPPLNPHRRCH